MTTPTNLPSDFEGTDAAQINEHKFEFTGKASELWPIIFKNLFFNIITLSLYRFWGRTNVRRYIWQNIRFKGDPLEYTGTGKELFIGFLIVLFGVFLPLSLLIFFAQTLVLEGSGLGILLSVLTYFILLFLLPLGIFKAQKYRLSRTRWRGIRGAVVGNGVDYAFAAIGYYLLLIITAGLAFPFVENKLYGKMTNATRFGDESFSYSALSGPLYGAFFIYIGFISASIIPIFLGLVILVPLMGIFGFVVAYGSFFLCVLAGGTFYMHRKYTHFSYNTKFQTGHFNFSGTFGNLLRVNIGNIFLLIITLGIAFPIVQMRLIRYLVSDMAFIGTLDLSKIAQTSEEEPSYGEGLAEGFDMGTI